MSHKNHEVLDGKRIQTNKKYSQLKLRQKEKIAEWMFLETKEYYTKNYTFPDETHIGEVIDRIYDKIKEAEIWIPYHEVFQRYRKKKVQIQNRVRRELSQMEHEQTEAVCFMNMCMIQDGKGNVLALDKVNDSYTGTTFPGGHVEKNEIFKQSIIREVREETGLEINNPLLYGIYHWMKAGVHNIIFLYKATEFSGTLKSSDEGKVYWIPMEEFEKKELATGMEYVLEIMGSEQVNECFMEMKNGKYIGNLY